MIHDMSNEKSSTYSADFADFGSGGGDVVIIARYLDPVLADRLDRSYAHALLVVVVVALLLVDEQLVAVTGEVRGRLDDLTGCRSGSGCLALRFSFRACRQLVLLRQSRFFCFLQVNSNL